VNDTLFLLKKVLIR